MVGNLIKYGAMGAKLRAMYAKRIRAEDYAALKEKKTIPEIVTYLKTHPGYEHLFAPLPNADINRETAEGILRRDPYDEYLRLARFVPARDAGFLSYMAVKCEMQLILQYVRCIMADETDGFRLNLPALFYRHSDVRFEEMTTAKTIGELAQALSNTAYGAILERFSKDNPLNYTGVEADFLTYYFRRLGDMARDTLEQQCREVMDSFIGEQTDLLNFTRIVRCKDFYKDANIIYSLLLPFTYKLSQSAIRAMVEAQTPREAFEQIYDTHYGAFFKQKQHTYVEDYMYDYIYERALSIMHGHIPSICQIYAYFVLKDNEISNLIHIIEGKRYAVPGAQLDQYLIGI